MIMALTAKNKVGFVDRTIVKPNSSDQKFATLRRCNTMILSWILSSIFKEIATGIIFVNSAEEM